MKRDPTHHAAVIAGLRKLTLSNPNASALERLLAETPPTPKPTRKRKPDFVKQVKRAIAAGLHVRSASVTADSVVVTFGEADAPAPADGTVIETEDELRKLI
jgi:hypothetical protein